MRKLPEEERIRRKKERQKKYYALNTLKARASRKAYYEKNKEAMSIKKREWYDRNKEKVRTNGIAIRKANPSKNRERCALFQKNNPSYRKQYAERNRDKLRTLALSYYYRHQEAISERCADWRKRNPDKIKARTKKYQQSRRDGNRKYIAIKKGAQIGNLKVISRWERVWRKSTIVICFWCRKSVHPKKCHMDHIYPLSKGGAHSIENLCISCQPCNNKKKDKTPEQWNAVIEQPALL